MKSKHRRSRRRYSGKRRSDRHRSLIAILLILAFTVAVVIGSVFLGKYLKQKAELSALERETTVDTEKNIIPETENEGLLSSARPKKSFAGEYLKAEDMEAFLSSEEYSKDVTLLLRDFEGKLYYSSPAAIQLGIQSAENGLMSCEDMIKALKDKGCYVSVCLTLSDHTKENAAATGAIHAFESAIIAEISRSGADEIILCGIKKMDSDRLEALKSLSESARKENGNSIPLGVLLPFSLFTESKANAVCAELSKYFEIFAADLTAIDPTAEQSPEEALDASLEVLQMYFSRYSLRAVFDTASSISEYEDTRLKEIAVTAKQRIPSELIFKDEIDSTATE